ncbi:MAG TPA: APC family permease [Candidatus Bathyarchaeia archaeon]|nr:APC family permease [Candidatus Bathyarchaeia archaeon]HKM79211.1 APC family permease [Candidatus Bathyarchaeia archaeon]
MVQKKAPVFVREATGLVRSLSFFDAFFSNLAVINIASALTFPVLLIVYSFPGASIPFAVLITLFPILLYNLLYASFTKMMPRSGGDYVFISRGLNPILGFAANFSFVLWNVFWIAVYANWVSTIGLGPLFYTLGLQSGSPYWIGVGGQLATPLYGFIIGSIVIVMITALAISGTNKVLRLQNVLVTVGIIGVIVGLIIPLVYPMNFASSIAPYISYQNVINSGPANGYTSAPFSFSDTILATGLVALTMLFGQFAVYMGGEVKRAEKTIPSSLLLTTLVTAGAMIVGGYIVHNVFGTAFSGAIQAMYYSGSSSYTFQVAPYYNFLVSLMSGNPIAIVVIGLSFAFWTMAGAIFNLMANSRCVMAWSFDRLFPDKFAYVSERYHTPVVSILFNAIGAELLLFLYTFYVSVVTFMAGTTLGYVLTFGSTAVAGILIPYRGKVKAIYERANLRKIAGIPVVCLAGLGTLIYFVVLGYALITNPVFGVNSPQSLLAIAAFWIAGIVIGSIFYYYRKSHGINISQAFEELPPE